VTPSRLLPLIAIFSLDPSFTRSLPIHTHTQGPPKKKYLDENWKLDAEDQKEFKGFPKKGDAIVPTEGDGIQEKFPVFALMYKVSFL
jgi:hypothetical protein